jgi:hypothetical protein
MRCSNEINESDSEQIGISSLSGIELRKIAEKANLH